MNWISERWLPIVIEFKGEVKFGKLPKKWTKDHLNQANTSETSDNNISKNLTKLTALTTAREFIEFGTIKLIFSEIKIKEPLFIFLEFDDYTPWLFEPNSTNEFITSFMVPPGTWKFFFTTQLG